MIEHWLRTRTQERLTVKEVENLFLAYSRLGILAQTAGLIESISEGNRLPILHTLTSHVTKEKPVITYSVLKSSTNFSEEKVVFVSSAVDLLWAFSLMYDDMFDHDQMRSGLPSAWVEFGIDETYKAAREGFDRVKAAADIDLFVGAGNTVDRFVNEGLDSLKQHRDMKPGVSVEGLIENYRKRALFHTVLPFILAGAERYGDSAAFLAIENLNLAGQILNDLKDVSPKYVWLRDGYSDMRSGVMTIPTAILLDHVSKNDRSRFLSFFGRDVIGDEEKRLILQMFNASGSLDLTKNLATELYELSRSQFRHILNQDFVGFAEDWINYKLEQLSELNV